MTKDKETLSSRLRYALELTGTRKADLARSINVSPQVINFLCSSNTKTSRFTFEIAMTLGLNTRWLATGEGTMFLADDPRHQFILDFQKIPILNKQEIIQQALYNNLNLDNHTNWTALKTNKTGIFAYTLPDSSMAPFLPCNSLLFVQESFSLAPENGDIIMAYLEEVNDIIVREIIYNQKEAYLYPHNKLLFKEHKYNEKVKFLGTIISCYWKLKEFHDE